MSILYDEDDFILKIKIFMKHYFFMTSFLKEVPIIVRVFVDHVYM